MYSNIMDIVKKHYPSKNLPKWVNKELFYAEKLKELQKGLEEFQTQEIEDPSDENPLTFYLNRKFLIPLQSSKLDLNRDCVSDIIDETVIMVATKSKAKKSTAAKKVTKKKSVIASSDDSSEEITKPKVPRPKKVVKKITKPAKKASAKKKQ
ncbi:MAG TPA: hypothetical protein PKD85_00340, partial [Saprospiraceae bacterium]|nr:hypothetical protein [Saprospiraceae bacterium]